jgi:hypothetical protein
MISQRSSPNLAIDNYSGISDSNITNPDKMVRKYIDEISYSVMSSNNTVKAADYNVY